MSVDLTYTLYFDYLPSATLKSCDMLPVCSTFYSLIACAKQCASTFSSSRTQRSPSRCHLASVDDMRTDPNYFDSVQTYARPGCRNEFLQLLAVNPLHIHVIKVNNHDRVQAQRKLQCTPCAQTLDRMA